MADQLNGPGVQRKPGVQRNTHQLMIVLHGSLGELLAIAGSLASEVVHESQIKKAEIREIQ